MHGLVAVEETEMMALARPSSSVLMYFNASCTLRCASAIFLSWGCSLYLANGRRSGSVKPAREPRRALLHNQS